MANVFAALEKSPVKRTQNMSRGLKVIVIFMISDIALLGVIAWSLQISIIKSYVIAFTLLALSLLGITLVAHRQETHQSIKLHPAVEFILRVAIYIQSGMKLWQWRAVHAIHHLFSDKEGDPHSPRIFGLFDIFFLTAYRYRQALQHNQSVIDFAATIQHDKDWFDRHIFNSEHSQGKYVGPVFILPLCQLLIAYLLMGFHPALWFVLFTWPYSIGFFLLAGGTINAAGHTSESKSPETDDYSRNISALLTLATAGEGTHFNHHLNPKNAKFNEKWWLDPGWMVFCVLRLLGLAQLTPA